VVKRQFGDGENHRVDGKTRKSNASPSRLHLHLHTACLSRPLHRLRHGRELSTLWDCLGDTSGVWVTLSCEWRGLKHRTYQTKVVSPTPKQIPSIPTLCAGPRSPGDNIHDDITTAKCIACIWGLETVFGSRCRGGGRDRKREKKHTTYRTKIVTSMPQQISFINLPVRLTLRTASHARVEIKLGVLGT
jgi:hypothetical protein